MNLVISVYSSYVNVNYHHLALLCDVMTTRGYLIVIVILI